jgi:excisionase family DNA binding protein
MVSHPSRDGFFISMRRFYMSDEEVRQKEAVDLVIRPDQGSQSSSSNLLQKEFLTISELAEVLQVQKSWLYAQTRQTGPGSIPCIRVGKYLRFHPPSVLEWLGIKPTAWFFRTSR